MNKNPLLNATIFGVLSAAFLTGSVSATDLSIVQPSNGIKTTNGLVTARGSASSKGGIDSVWYQLNHGGWLPASGSTNWSVGSLTLVPGPNTFQAYAVDTHTVRSATNQVSLTYVVNAPISFTTIGRGSISPNYSNALLELAKTYTVTAEPGTGFAFSRWTDGNGTTVTNKATLAFTMAPSLAFTANFIDIARPTLTLTTPTASLRVSNSVFTARGKAADNLGVDAVWFQLNGGGWVRAIGTTNWSADNLILTPGGNTFQAYAVDTASNYSITNKTTFNYVLTAPLTLATTGRGSISPNYSNAVLEVGKTYTLTAKPASGFALTNWTDGNGTTVTNKATLPFIMAPSLAFTANFVDIARPTLTLTTPTASLRVSNSVFTARGKAADNLGVDAVWFQLNGGGWVRAIGTTNWSADNLILTPGVNTLQAYAVDAASNYSITNKTTFNYVLTAPLTLATTGRGSISPNYSNAVLEVGKTYTLTAKPASGFALTNWTDGSDRIITNNASLSFVMTRDLSLTAHFVDVSRPLNVVTYPSVNQVLSAPGLTVLGKASDNVGVQQVYYRLNSLDWAAVNSSNQFTNWNTPELSLTPGTNVIQTFAVDPAGNTSSTNLIRFTYYVAPDWAPDSVVGLTVEATAARGSMFDGDVSLFTFGGDNSNAPSTYVKTDVYSDSGVDFHDVSAGICSYQKLSPKSANVTFTTQTSGSSDPYSGTTFFVRFTGVGQGVYTNMDSTTNHGTFHTLTTPKLGPQSLAGRSLTIFIPDSSLGSATVTFNSDGSYTAEAQLGGMISTQGTYIYSRYSANGALISVQDQSGGPLAIPLTFTTSTAGYYSTPYGFGGTFSLH